MGNKNQLLKLILAGVTAFSLTNANAAELFRDDFNQEPADGNLANECHVFFPSDPVDCDTLVNPEGNQYWTEFRDTYSAGVVFQEAGGLLKMETSNTRGAGIIMNMYDYFNHDAVSLQEPILNADGTQAKDNLGRPAASWYNGLDPRLEFFNPPDPAIPNRYVRLEGINIQGLHHKSYYGVKLLVMSRADEKAPYRSNFQVIVYADKRLEVKRINGTTKQPMFVYYLQQVPSSLELILDDTHYRVTAYFQYPQSSRPDLYAGSATFTGEHGLDPDMWAEQSKGAWTDAPNGLPGAAIGIQAFSRDPANINNAVTVALDSVSFGDNAETVTNLGFGN